MANSRNIDIKRVAKLQANRQSNPGLDIKAKPKSKIATTVKPKPSLRTAVRKSKSSVKRPSTIKRRRAERAGYFDIQLAAWQAVATADIFQFSFVRNLFSLRVIFFAVLPIFIYQLRYILVLKPDELLGWAKTSLGAENTSAIIATGLAILTLAIISWLADTLITPAVLRYRYQQLDNRRATISRSLRESSSVVLHNVWQKTVKTALFIALALIFLIGIYVSYVLGYGSTQQQVVFVSILSLGVFIALIMYWALRFYLQTVTAIVDGSERSGIAMAFRHLARHPLSSFGYSLSWFIGLLLSVLLSAAIVAGVVYGLDNSQLVSLHIILLAGSTTLICIVWTIWSAWQNGYWAKVVHSRGSELRLVVGHPDQLRYWHFLILIIIVLFLVTFYIILAYLFAEQINAGLRALSSQLPQTFELNLPKPQ